MAEIPGRFKNGIIVRDEPFDVPDGTCVRIELLIIKATHVRRRQGGLWKAQVAIAPDFDVLPAEVAAAFGVNDPRVSLIDNHVQRNSGISRGRRIRR